MLSATWNFGSVTCVACCSPTSDAHKLGVFGSLWLLLFTALDGCRLGRAETILCIS